ncbi:hypothetical protein PM082_014667 [Marasmius tenuissimus]|nr:hypothetical protein PM082_014667 [Marasmius tenuissimus]
MKELRTDHAKAVSLALLARFDAQTLEQDPGSSRFDLIPEKDLSAISEHPGNRDLELNRAVVREIIKYRLDNDWSPSSVAGRYDETNELH